jgi:GNAT superfamily N-acetyltransferase
VTAGEQSIGEVDYRDELPSPEAFLRLFASTGWTTNLSPDRLAGALDASWHCVCALRGDRLVGMGRTVSDGALHALIVEVIVEPEWQGHGVGREIMDRLVRRCREAGIDQVQLFCAAGKRGFYERIGFEARPDEAPGMELSR